MSEKKRNRAGGYQQPGKGSDRQRATVSYAPSAPAGVGSGKKLAKKRTVTVWVWYWKGPVSDSVSLRYSEGAALICRGRDAEDGYRVGPLTKIEVPLE